MGRGSIENHDDLPLRVGLSDLGQESSHEVGIHRLCHHPSPGILPGVRWPHTRSGIPGPAPSGPWVEKAGGPNNGTDRSSVQTGLRPGKEALTDFCPSPSAFPRGFQGVFFKVLLRLRLRLGMAGIGSDLAPPMPGQHPVDGRRRNLLSDPFLVGRMNGGDDDDPAVLCLFEPGARKAFSSSGLRSSR